MIIRRIGEIPADLRLLREKSHRPIGPQTLNDGMYSARQHPLFYDNLDTQTLIDRAGITPRNLAVMREKSAGVFGLTDFMQFAQTSGVDFSGGYSLGMQITGGIYVGINKALGLQHWADAYIKKGLWPAEPATARFLDIITQEDTPIVFTIPPHVFSHTPALLPCETRTELRWLLKHPERMKNVYFVFGLFDTVDRRVLRTLWKDPQFRPTPDTPSYKTEDVDIDNRIAAIATSLRALAQHEETSQS